MVDWQDSLEHSVSESLAKHGQKPSMEQPRSFIKRVLFFFYEGYRPTPQRIAELGGGWVAAEALDIGLRYASYCCWLTARALSRRS